jgi:predicted nucleic acid-binding protein
MSRCEIREVPEVVRTVCDVESMSEVSHERGFAVCERYRFSIYDSMIVASALLANCRALFSEDLQDQRLIDGRLPIRDPPPARRARRGCAAPG